MSWEKSRLDEICSLVTDGKHGDCQPQQGSGYYFISSKDVSDWKINYEKARQITKDDFQDTHKRTKFEPFDVVITNSGTIGRIAVAKDEEKTYQTTFQKSVAIVKPIKEKVNPFFLAYALNNLKERLENQSSGTAQKNLLLKDLRRFEVPLPPLPTQQKIASILSTYDDLIENNLRRIRLLEEAAQHLYREWFVRFRFPGWEEVRFLDGLPEGWEKVNLYEFANLKMGFPFKAEDFNEEKNGTPVIRIRDIPNHWTNTYSKSSTSDDYWVEKNDIVIGMDGFFYTDVWGGQRGYLVQRVCRIRPNDERLNGYLLEAIREPIKYFEKTISGATVAHLGAKHLKEIEIINPPEKLIPELEVFSNMIEQRVNLLLQNQKLKEARDILLPRLMNQTIEI